MRASRGSLCFKKMKEQIGEQVAVPVGINLSLAEDDGPKATHVSAVIVVIEFALQAVVIAVRTIINENLRAASGRELYGIKMSLIREVATFMCLK